MAAKTESTLTWKRVHDLLASLDMRSNHQIDSSWPLADRLLGGWVLDLAKAPIVQHDIAFLKELSHGSGKVFLGRHVISGNAVAVKFLDRRELRSMNQIESSSGEIQRPSATFVSPVLSALQSPTTTILVLKFVFGFLVLKHAAMNLVEISSVFCAPMVLQRLS